MDMIPVGIRAKARREKSMVKALQKKDRKHPIRGMVDEEEERVEGEIGEGKRKKEKEVKGKRRKETVKSVIERLRERKWGWGKGKMEDWKEWHKGERWWEGEAMENIEIVIEEFRDAEEIRQRKRVEEEKEVLFYVDGSKLEGRVGGGACRAGGKWWNQSWFLGKQMEVVDAEMIGIKKALERGLKECWGENIERVTVVCDSQQAIIRSGQREASKGEQIAFDIRYLAHAYLQRGINVRLEWCKAHAGIAGNERADKLAKDGTRKKSRDREAFVSFSYMERRIREETIEEWEKRFEEDTRRGTHYGLTPKTRHAVRYQPFIRYEKVLLSRLRTEHIAVRKFLKKIGKVDSDECQCGEGRQDVKHVLEVCTMGEEARKEAAGKGVESMETMLYSQEGAEWGVKIFSEFVSKGGMTEREDINWLNWGRGTIEE